MTSAASRHIELLAPAGEPRALRAALAAGADAVYFGLERWSARAFAGNFALETAVDAVDLAHRWDASAYLALNTLLKDSEVEEALAALEAPYRAGLDGLIVADLGLAALVREQYPALPLHASTQLDTHSSSQLEALSRLGFSRAVLARELSLDEIAALDVHGLDVEAFVHGALCYGYSGDCLLSSMVGGRSGNRGRCSQSCRLRYDLRRADAKGPADAERAPGRVLSTSDLAAIAALPALLAAGVTAFKIEGRMKDASYVGVTTSVYRDALDAAAADPEAYQVRPEWTERLEQSFSRGFTTAHLEGRHHEVRSGGRGGHRGVLVGRVSRVDDERGEVEVRLSRPVAAGDLVYLYTPWGQSEPLRVPERGDARLTLRVRERVAVKDRLFRLETAGAGELANDLVAGRSAARPLQLDMRLEGRAGVPAALTVTAGAGAQSVTVVADRELSAARTAALTAERAREALGALGGTPYRLATLDFDVGVGLFFGVGDLKELRRRAVAALDERRLAARRRDAGRRAANVPAAPAAGAAGGAERGRVAAGAAGVILVLRPGERPLPAPGVTAVCLDVATTDPLKAVERSAALLAEAGVPLRVRLPEVLFDGDEGWWRAVLGLPWQAVYARHLGVLAALSRSLEQPYVLEYPLQGLNGLAAGVAHELAGRPPAAVVASPEASLDEVAALATGSGPPPADKAARAAAPPADQAARAAAPPAARHAWPAAVEALAFGRQQVLRTRDQLGRAEGLYEAPGPGEHVGLLLEDVKAYRFPADADATGTRLFNARVTNLAPNLDELHEAGVGALLVVQADLDEAERRAFSADGLTALARHAARDRSTTGHLFRGVP